MRFDRAAWPFVAPFAALAALLAALGRPGRALASAVGGFLVLLFFRDPERRFEGTSENLVAPADGVVTRVDTVEDPAVGSGPLRRVVTFLSVFDVHVQCCPTEGEVVGLVHKPGKKVAAFVEDADRVNESHLTVLRRPDGAVVGVRQIAGLVARRIVCRLVPGQRVERGEHLGLIKFGSRVDLLMPASYRVTVERGDRVRNGETIIAVAGDADREATP